MFDIVYELPQVVSGAFVVLAAAIAMDTVLGVILAIKHKEFEISFLPGFLANGILPYVGGLGVVALGAHFVGQPFEGIFFAAGAMVIAKYIAEIGGKLKELFGF